MGDFLWDELWTTDVENASAFYSSLAGLTAGTVDGEPNKAAAATYRLRKAGDIPRVGIMPGPPDGPNPEWVTLHEGRESGDDCISCGRTGRPRHR